jgi:environmental stress-induced protein Ves
MEQLTRRGIVTPEAVDSQPWRNGLGTTRVIHESLAWRLSLAEIRGTLSFSSFPGLDRILVLVSEAPLTLTIDGELRRLSRGRLVGFAGEASVMPSPASSGATVLNLMTARSIAESTASPVLIDGELVVPPSTTAILGILAGDLRWNGILLPVGTVLLPSAAERILEGEGEVVEFRVQPVSERD